MKKISFYISFCFLFAISSGCNKFLEKEPDNRAKLDSPEKVSELLGTAYPEANYQAFAETMTDNVTDIGKGEMITPFTTLIFLSIQKRISKTLPNFTGMDVMLL